MRKSRTIPSIIVLFHTRNLLFPEYDVLKFRSLYAFHNFQDLVWIIEKFYSRKLIKMKHLKDKY